MKIRRLLSLCVVFSFVMNPLVRNGVVLARDKEVNQGQEWVLLPGRLELEPNKPDDAVLFCPGTGTGDVNIASSGIRFTVSEDFRGVEVKLAAFPIGDYIIDAELRSGTGFTTTPIATRRLFIPIEDVPGNHPYKVYAILFGLIDVTGSQTFTLKFNLISGAGPVKLETFGANAPCGNMGVTADVTGSNPSLVGDPAGFKVVTQVYVPRFNNSPNIDGIIDKNEWDLSKAITFDNGFIALQYTFSRLYLLVDVINDSYNDPGYDGDYLYLTFDTNGDSEITPFRDVNYAIDSAGNMRRQYYTGPASWSEFSATRSSRAKNFRCEYEDGTYGLISYFPLHWNCSKHRIWEIAIDLEEIEAWEGSTIHFGFMVFSQTPFILDKSPMNFVSDFTDLHVIMLPHTPLLGVDSGAGAWLDPHPIEVTQATQAKYNTLPLVAGKDTAVRVYGSVYYIQKRQKMFAFLYGSRDGVDLPGSPLYQIYDAPVETESWGESYWDSANFLLPEAWTYGSIELRAQIVVPGGSSDGPSSPLSITFQERRVPTYWYVRLNEQTVNCTYDNPLLVDYDLINANLSYIETVYPVPDIDWVERPWQEFGCGSNPDAIIPFMEEYYKAILLAWYLNVAFGNPPPYTIPEQVFGFPLTESGGQSNPIWGGGFGRVAYGNNGMSSTLAHEITHNLDTSSTGTWGRHVYGGSWWWCRAPGPDPNWPYPDDPDIYETGFDTRLPWTSGGVANAVIYDGKPDFMSYCTLSDEPKQWISPYRWQNLFPVFAPLDLAQAVYRVNTIEPVYYISGAINPDGSGNLNPVLIQPGSADVSTPSGSASIEIRDASDVLLYEHLFPVEFISEFGSPEKPVEFFFMLPQQAGASKITLKYLGTVIDQILISAHAPSVTLVSPNGGESWDAQPQTVSWTYSDLDSDPLTFYLQYSPDNGVSWYEAGRSLTGNSATVYPASLPGGSQALLRILASDGVNTSTDVSDAAFTVSNKTPVVTIFKDPAGELILYGDVIHLSSQVFDAEESDLPEENFVWVADEEVWGVGKSLDLSLEPGTYQITLYVTDAQGNTGTAQVTIRVVLQVFLPVLLRY